MNPTKKYNIIPAPVALFAFNRVAHLQRTIGALQRNEFAESTALWVFSDGARGPSDTVKVAQVREYLREIKGFASINIVENAVNLGLARSIISGVDAMLSKYDRVIVLEDDIVTSKFFLRFMNEALECYKNTHEVVSISGYIYRIETGLPSTFLLRGTDCWGWATWRRGWSCFNPDGGVLLAQLCQRKLEFEFNYEGSVDYIDMLRAQVKGENDSWAIRWYAAAFLADKLTLYPGVSLVQNIGNDGSGSHAIATDWYEIALAGWNPDVGDIPVEENRAVRREVARHLWRRRRGGRLLARFPALWPLVSSLS